MTLALPRMSARGTKPQNRLSQLSSRLSPNTEILSRRHNDLTILYRAANFRVPGGSGSQNVLRIQWREIVAGAKLD